MADRRQYTVRNVPDEVDRVLRDRAGRTGKSFNQVLLEALAYSANTSAPRRDLSDVVNTISKEEASKREEEIRRQRQIDPELW